MEVGFGQCRTISKLLCDRQFRPREICQKIDCLYSAAKSLFFTSCILGKCKTLQYKLEEYDHLKKILIKHIKNT